MGAIEDETLKEGMDRLIKEFRERGIRHKKTKKRSVLTEVGYSAGTLIEKFEKRWGHKPETYCFLKLGKGVGAKVYVLLAPHTADEEV